MIYRQSAKPVVIEHRHGWLMKIKRLFQRVFVRINIWSNKIPIWPFTPIVYRTRRYETGRLTAKRSPFDLRKAANRKPRPRPWIDPIPSLPPIPRSRVNPIFEDEDVYQINYEKEAMADNWKQYMNSKGLDVGYIKHRDYEMHNGLKILNKQYWDMHRAEWIRNKIIKTGK